MKKFFKKNLWAIIMLALGVLLMLLGVLSPYCLLIACLLIGTVFIHFGRVCSSKIKQKLEDNSEEEDYFDATKFDFDEDVYFIGDPDKPKTKVAKKSFAKLSAKAPALGLYLLGIAFISISVMTIIKALI